MADAIRRHYELRDEVMAAHQGLGPVEQGEVDRVVGVFTHAAQVVAPPRPGTGGLSEELSWLPVRTAVHTGEAQLRDEGTTSAAGASDALGSGAARRWPGAGVGSDSSAGVGRARRRGVGGPRRGPPARPRQCASSRPAPAPCCATTPTRPPPLHSKPLHERTPPRHGSRAALSPRRRRRVRHPSARRTWLSPGWQDAVVLHWFVAGGLRRGRHCGPAIDGVTIASLVRGLT
jgi:hypothetical protein